MTKHNIKRPNKTRKINCSPKPKNQMNGFSCYTNETLYKLRDLWNIRHPDNKIHEGVSPKEIHRKLTLYMRKVCNQEYCWMKEFAGAKPLIKASFAPPSPKEWKTNPNEWLSSTEIIEVMQQYEKAYSCFECIGPSPIDFDTKYLHGKCVWEELCNFSVQKQIQNKKTKIGIIFNTDTHDKPGQHWISMFINIRKNTIFFFDSTGDPAPKEILVFIDRIKQQGKHMSPPIHFIVDSNEGVEHQYGNTECGVYSLFFIIHMLEDKLTANYLKTHILKDKYIEKYRKIYFNENDIFT
jgi:hypothetical protein